MGSGRGTEDLVLLGALRMPTLTLRNRSSPAFFLANFCVMVRCLTLLAVFFLPLPPPPFLWNVLSFMFFRLPRDKLLDAEEDHALLATDRPDPLLLV